MDINAETTLKINVFQMVVTEASKRCEVTASGDDFRGRMQQGCGIRAPMDGFMACLESHLQR